MTNKVLTQGQLLKALLDAGVTPETDTPVRIVDDLFPNTTDYKMAHIAEDIVSREEGMLIVARGNDSTPVAKELIK